MPAAPSARRAIRSNSVQSACGSVARAISAGRPGRFWTIQNSRCFATTRSVSAASCPGRSTNSVGSSRIRTYSILSDYDVVPTSRLPAFAEDRHPAAIQGTHHVVDGAHVAFVLADAPLALLEHESQNHRVEASSNQLTRSRRRMSSRRADDPRPWASSLAALRRAARDGLGTTRRNEASGNGSSPSHR